MVPGCAAQPCLAAVAVPLPAGRFPVSAAGRGERPPVPGRTRVRAAGHRRVRRQPVLVGGCRLCEGVTDRGAGPDHRARTTGRRRRRCRCCRPCGSATPGGSPGPSRRRCSWTATASPSSIRGCPGTGSTPPRPRTASQPQALFCDNETNTARLFGSAPITAYPEGRDQRPRGLRRADGEPRPAGHQGRLVVPADRAGRRDGRAAAAAAPTRTRQPAASRQAAWHGRLLRRRHDRPGAGGRRVLRRDRARRTPTRNGCGCCGSPAPGWSGASRCTRTG